MRRFLSATDLVRAVIGEIAAGLALDGSSQHQIDFLSLKRFDASRVVEGGWHLEHTVRIPMKSVKIESSLDLPWLRFGAAESGGGRIDRRFFKALGNSIAHPGQKPKPKPPASPKRSKSKGAQQAADYPPTPPPIEPPTPTPSATTSQPPVRQASAPPQNQKAKRDVPYAIPVQTSPAS